MSYDYGYSYDAGTAVATGLGAVFGFMIFIYIIVLAVSVFSIVCNWKVFKKAGKNGWEAIVPIYNFVVLLEITNLPMWYLALFLVPIGNVVVMFLIYIELAKKFGQSVGFGIGLALLNPIFMAILAFNKNYVYQGVAPVNNGQMYNQPNYQQPVNNGQMYNQPNYGQPINNGQMYNQPNYGQPVNNGQMYNQQPVMNQPEQPVAPQPVQSNNCSSCGAPVNPGDKFCMSCGSQL